MCWRKVRTAQGGVAANGCPPKGEDQSNRDESAVSARMLPGETGNLYAQQYQIGTRRSGPGSVRVGSTEPSQRCTAQTNGGHGGPSQEAPVAQNPAYRLASHFMLAGLNPDSATLWRAPRWALAFLLACLGMLGPFSIDTYLPAFT